MPEPISPSDKGPEFWKQQLGTHRYQRNPLKEELGSVIAADSIGALNLGHAVGHAEGLGDRNKAVDEAKSAAKTEAKKWSHNKVKVATSVATGVVLAGGVGLYAHHQDGNTITTLKQQAAAAANS